MNLTSHPGMCSSSISSHAEMSQYDLSGNPVPCLSVAHTERCSGLLLASDEARKDVTSVSSVDAFFRACADELLLVLLSHSTLIPLELLAGPGLARRQALRMWLSARSLCLSRPH